MVKAGALRRCEFITVESEFAAMSAAIGASAAGARTYTATASQGLLYMAEALFNAAGLGLPIVMTVANRAIGAPINIWNDHSDAMSQRDCGWVQLYAADNQEAVDLHVLAFRLAEQLSVPAMVCVDGFVLTHAFEPLELPASRAGPLLPCYSRGRSLDPDEPVTIGAMVGPEAFTEVRYLAHQQLQRRDQAIRRVADEYAARTGRDWRRCRATARRRADGGGRARLGARHARGRGRRPHATARSGSSTLTLYRPFPAAAVREALRRRGARDRARTGVRAGRRRHRRGRRPHRTGRFADADRAPSSRASAAAHHQESVRGCSRTRRRTDAASGTVTFLDLRTDVVDAGSCRGRRPAATPGRRAATCCGNRRHPAPTS